MASKFAYGSDVGVPSYNAIIDFERSSGIGFSVSATTGGSHVSGSYHYKGNAVDTSSSPGNMQSLAAWLYGYYPFILELIHAGGPGYFVKNGQKVGAAYYGASTVSQHYNHVHCAMTLSGIAAAKGLGAAGAAGGSEASLTSSGGGKLSGCLGVFLIGGVTLLGGGVSAYEALRVLF